VFLGLAAFSFSMLGAFLVRSGILTSVHAFAVDPKRGAILLGILALAAGSALSLFAWRAPLLKAGGLFAPISREGALVINNLFLATAALTVMAGTLYPLIYQAATGQPLSVGAPWFNLTFAPLMTAVLILLPVGTLLSWKRADARGAVERLWAAGLLALATGIGVFALQNAKGAFAAIGLALGVWLIAGAVTELAVRIRLFRAPLKEVANRLTGLPRGAFGMTLAHIGVGVFVLGACVETGWRVEAAQALKLGDRVQVGAYSLSLTDVTQAEGPNYSAERATVRIKGPQGDSVLYPERRFYPANRQTVSQVAIETHGPSDLYVVFGERREGTDPSWLIRAYWNPWARMIFGGPLLMALGGLVSLSDRRLRMAAGAKARAAAAGAGA
jgi:cytochrome c-type biogenesis protein CcmF